MYNYFKNFINKNTYRFPNLKKFFTIRSLFILIIALLFYFSLRWFVIVYFNYNLFVFKDFCLIGILACFIDPLFQDIYEIFHPNLNRRVHRSLQVKMRNPFSESEKENFERNQRDRPQQSQSNDSHPNVNNDYTDYPQKSKDFKYKVKRIFLWVVFLLFLWVVFLLFLAIVILIL